MINSPGGSNTVQFNVPNTPGRYLFDAVATDLGTNAPFTFSSTKTTISVNVLVAGAPTPTNPAIDKGQSITLNANPSGGTGIYNDYQWYSSASNIIQRPWNNWNLSSQGTLLDSMESGSWEGFYTGSTASINTTNYVEGGGSIQLTIAPNSAHNGAFDKSVGTLDLSNAKNFYFWVYINNMSQLLPPPGRFAVTLYFLNNGGSYFQCGIQTAGLQQGWNPIVVASSVCTPQGGTPTWNNINTIRFAVELNTTVTKPVSIDFDNLRYNYNGGAFGEAQVILTFDGSWNSTLINATPILQANHQTGVAYIVTNEINDVPGDGCGAGKCINTSQLDQLYLDGWDLSSHTANHADLVNRTADVKTIGVNDSFELAQSYNTLANLGFKSSAIFFAYPNGAYNAVVINQIETQTNYVNARALGYGITTPNLYPDDPYNLSYRIQSLTMTPSVTPAMVEADIQNVTAQKGLLVLTFHIIQPNTPGVDPTTSVEYPTANFILISDYLANAQANGILQVTNFSNYYAIENGTIFNAISSTSGPALTVAPTSNTFYYYRVGSGPFVEYSSTGSCLEEPAAHDSAKCLIQPNRRRSVSNIYQCDSARHALLHLGIHRFRRKLHSEWEFNNVYWRRHLFVD